MAIGQRGLPIWTDWRAYLTYEEASGTWRQIYAFS